MPDRKYRFSWDLIGDIELGRPNLGPLMRIEVYRLMQFAFRDVLESHYGTAQTDALFYEAGKLAGTAFYNRFCSGITDLNEFVRTLQEILRELGIGIMRVESADEEKGSFVITMSEDLDCSGLPELDYEVCVYDEGFIAGLMEGFTGRKFKVKEVDCWCTGDRTCRFTAQAEEKA
ncbi:MAG: 4-vinyl reductase [Desulfomicrobium sp.]|nr:4-vinyl reductase [Pseudomonadota bacterium]MBV1710396.1 4-vinyl reductase [Desulfomicrobium sp.]MBU4570017.1 4-vinyl reductase [Pseudomonadota bacterium]MBU4593935.1 4-vinyl reductase [Pseudomonadota bacterium]MBV1721068.1 4-vinyl reductase [Desulfomicrobium sp.]